jgi:hypothetical protein
VRPRGNDGRHQGGRAAAVVGELAIPFMKIGAAPLICNDERSLARFLVSRGPRLTRTVRCRPCCSS